MALQHTDAQFDEILTKKAVALYEDRMDFAVAGQGAIPMIPTPVINGSYKKWKASDFRRRNVEKRASGTDFKRINLDLEDVAYSCKEQGFESAIDDRDANQIENAFEDMAMKMVEDGFAQFDIELTANLVSSVFTNYKTGHATTADSTHFVQWSEATSTPIDDIDAYKVLIKGQLGVNPDSLLLTEDVFLALKKNAQIIARMSTSADKIVTLEKLKTFFGIPNIYVMAGTQTTTADGQATQTIADIATDTALLYYRGSNDSALTPSAIKCFYNTSNSGSGTNGIILETYRDNQKRSDVARLVQDFTIKATMPEGALLLVDVLK